MKTITTANTGNTESTEFTRPRLPLFVLSATQALNAASFEVDPATVIMQSKTISSAAVSATPPVSTRIGKRAKSIIVTPHAM